MYTYIIYILYMVVWTKNIGFTSRKEPKMAANVEKKMLKELQSSKGIAMLYFLSKSGKRIRKRDAHLAFKQFSRPHTWYSV